jgi:hypothetical protein
VGHTYYDLVSSIVLKLVNHCLHTRNKRLASFQTKPLHCIELDRDKLSEPISPNKSIQDVSSFCFVVLVVLEKLKLVPYPFQLLNVRDVHVLNANFAAVSCL